MTNIVHVEAVDDLTVNITTKTPDGTFVYAASSIYYSSPKRWEALGRDWSISRNIRQAGPGCSTSWFLANNSRWCASPDTGTKIEYPNATGWCCGPFRTRQPELPRFCQSGQPHRGASARRRSADRSVGHATDYQRLSAYLALHAKLSADSPFRDIRLRKAANLAVDRDAVVKLLRGLARPAKGLVVPTHPWFGKPTFDIKYDPDAARKLMADAGFGPKNRAKIKFLISSAGSGQMQPLPMNELIQQNFQDVGIRCDARND